MLACLPFFPCGNWLRELLIQKKDNCEKKTKTVTWEKLMILCVKHLHWELKLRSLPETTKEEKSSWPGGGA